MDITRLGGPAPQNGVGVVAPFDFALDRELWRWVPDDVSLHLTRTPFVPVAPEPDPLRAASERATLRTAVRALLAVEPRVVAYACASGSFAAGLGGERAVRAAMSAGLAGPAAGVSAVTASGALLDALRELGALRVAVISPYTPSVTDRLAAFLAEGGVRTTARRYLGPLAEPWRLTYREVADLARGVPVRGADALVIGSANLPTYDVIPQLEAELRMPVLTVNQVTVWGALRLLGRRPVGAYQALSGLSEVGHVSAPPGAVPRRTAERPT
jgi:maleate isomerase